MRFAGLYDQNCKKFTVKNVLKIKKNSKQSITFLLGLQSLGEASNSLEKTSSSSKHDVLVFFFLWPFLPPFVRDLLKNKD
jgi:hypothetical protein